MFKISGIFRKLWEEREKASSDGLDSGYELEAGSAAAKKAGFASGQPNKISLSVAVHKELENITKTDIGELYAKAFVCLKQAYTTGQLPNEGLIGETTRIAESIVEAVVGGNKNLLRLCFSDYANLDEYVMYHALNVCIIALEIGKGLELSRERLVELGLGALMHDIGLMKYADIIKKPAVLSKDEFSKIKEHPTAGAEMLAGFGKDISNSIFEVIRQEHERVDGSGYPQGIKDKQISEYAKIVGIADVYEALTHRRPYRNKLSPLETMKTILGIKNAFDPKVTKLLIERIGIFPLGSLVRLNTKEMGVVIKENADLPLRPTVNILYDGYGKELKESRQINLADNSMVYIEECLAS